MKATNEEIKRRIPSGFKLILDRRFTLPTDKEFEETAQRFVGHRHLISELIKELDKPTATVGSVKAVVDKNFGVVKQFDYAPDSHDCDNAAMELLAWLSFLEKGYAAGLGVLDKHALVILINDKQEFKFMDQYTGKLIEVLERLKVSVML